MKIVEHISHIIDSVDIIDIAHSYKLADENEGITGCFGGHGNDPTTLRFDPETQTCHCSDPECRMHGNIMDLVQVTENRISFPDAVNLIANRIGVDPLPASEDLQQYVQVRSCLQAAARFYARNLDAAMPYVTARGISRETAQRYLVGMAKSKDDLIKALKKEGFKKDIISAAGLLNQHGKDFFRDRTIVPIRMSGQVVGLYGRALNDNDEVRHLRMSNDRVIIGEGSFNLNPRREEIIMVEGMYDALALIDRGYTNAVATFGTQGFSVARNRDLFQSSRVRRIYVCFDGDSAGNASATKTAYEMEGMGKEVRVVDLGQEDPNEFVLNHSAEDFTERLRGSLAPTQFQISRVDDALELEGKIATLEPVFRRVKDMLPLEREATVKRIAKKLTVSKKVVEDHIASLADLDNEALRFLDLTDKQIIHPALDMAGDTLLMTVPQASTNPETGATEWVPFIITSGQEFFRESGGHTGFANGPDYHAALLRSGDQRKGGEPE